jgi:hypothetical protein
MWTKREKGIAAMYRRYAGIPDQEYRQALYEATGARSSTAKWLTQYHFDVFMPVLEFRAEIAHANGKGVGAVPAKIRDWKYWRKRNPNNGSMNTRMRAKIFALFADLRPFLDDPPSDPIHYLSGVVEHATGKPVTSFFGITNGDANLLIEALKDRLKHAVRRGA